MVLDLNQMFEAQMQWVYDDGFFYITGRDVVAIIIGILLGLVFAGVMAIIHDVEERSKNDRLGKKNDRDNRKGLR